MFIGKHATNLILSGTGYSSAKAADITQSKLLLISALLHPFTNVGILQLQMAVRLCKWLGASNSWLKFIGLYLICRNMRDQ